MAVDQSKRRGLSASTRAISIRQPWAARILAGRKTFEVRTWATSYRGALVIHAPRTGGLSRYPRGGLVGVVTLVDVESRPGAYRWLLEKPRQLQRMIPYRGRLGLFPLPRRVLNRLTLQLRPKGNTSPNKFRSWPHGVVPITQKRRNKQ